MKKILSILLSLCIICLFISCKNSSSMPLEVMSAYAVPGMFCPDTKGNVCKIIEQDAEGRVLFSYTGYNLFSEKEETVIVILQKVDKEYVWFLEDECYLFSTDEIAVEELKEKNDWGTPLDESRLSFRKYNVSMDGYIMTDSKLSIPKFREACCKALSVEESQITDYGFVDIDSESKQLFCVTVQKNAKFEKYLVLVDLEYKISFIEICWDETFLSTFIEFKQANDWKYR